jgi:hypothetical protein
VIRFSRDDIKRMIASVEKMRANAEDLEPGLLRGGAAVAKAEIDRIEAGGPGWPANRAGTPLGHRSGRMLNSLAPQNSVHVISGGVRVETNVDYAKYFNYGTGIYAGHKPWVTHRSTKLASSMGAAGITREIKHNGQPTRRFKYIDAPLATNVREILKAHIFGKGVAGA